MRDTDSGWNALVVAGFFFINPVLGLVGLCLMGWGAALAARPHRPYQKPLTLDDAYRMTGRAPPSLAIVRPKRRNLIVAIVLALLFVALVWGHHQ